MTLKILEVHERLSFMFDFLPNLLLLGVEMMHGALKQGVYSKYTTYKKPQIDFAYLIYRVFHKLSMQNGLYVKETFKVKLSAVPD